MSNIINNDKLSFVLTTYGLRRIAEALADPTVSIQISKGIVGDANNEFYEPNETMSSLVHPIENGSFPIIQKELLEDNLTVSFLFEMPISFNNCEIREVGLYETINEVDYLFAIGTQQPILKPSVEDNYFINVDYYIMLKSANLAEVYDQIVLNPENMVVTEEDLENLMSSLVFTQGNLSLQIGNNSHVIGLNRGTMLYENMTKYREANGYLCFSQMYSTLLKMVNPYNIFSFWLFDYPKTINDRYSITDISLNNNNLSGNLSVNLYNKDFMGVLSSLIFNSPNYYYLGAETPLVFNDSDTNNDLPFSIFYALEPVDTNNDRTILARSNYITSTHAFEIKELNTGVLQIKLFSDENNFITFTSPVRDAINKKHSVLLSYNNSTNNFTAFINGQKVELLKEVTGTYTHMSTTPTTLYGFSYDTSKVIYTDNNSTITSLVNSDGTPYSGTEWIILDNTPYYNLNASSYTESLNTVTDELYAWVYTDSPNEYIIYTKELTIIENTVLYNSDYTEYTGTDFTVTLSGSDYIIQYGANATTYTSADNIQPKTLYAWKYNGVLENIWANSNSNPLILFDNNGNLYEGTEWTINNNNIYYNGNLASYNSSLNFDIPALEVTSYIVNSLGGKEDFVNSEISLLSIVKGEALSESDLQILALEVESAIGNNPCLINN